jgi:hypothetical protein
MERAAGLQYGEVTGAAERAAAHTNILRMIRKGLVRVAQRRGGTKQQQCSTYEIQAPLE